MGWVINCTKFVLAVALAALCGCRNLHVEEPSSLGPNEAFIIVNVRSNADIFRQFIHEYELKGMQKIFGNPIAEITSPGLKIFKVPCEELYFSHIVIANKTTQQTEDRANAFKFTPKPGSLNYVGDVVIVVSESTAKYGLVDNEAKTVAQARSSYASFFETYPYAKNVAHH